MTIQFILKLQTRKVEKFTFTTLILKVDNFEKYTVGGNAFQTLITRSTEKKTFA